MREGQRTKIYQQWQNNEKEIGEATLLSKVRTGLPFIIEDTYEDPLLENNRLRIPEALTPVYNSERWLVKFESITPYGESTVKVGDIREYNIRYLEAIGISRSSDSEQEYVQERILPDRFIMVDGVEVF